MKKTIFISLTLFIILSACENPKTVSYYLEHPDEMKAKIEECNEDATKLVKDPDCINARSAKRENFWSPVKVNKSNPSPGINPLKKQQ